MIEKLKNLFKAPRNDMLLRIYAIVLAILIWFIISITLYPTTTKTINNIPLSKIDIKGTIAEDYALSPVTMKDIDITARIFGKRIDIGNFSASDLVANVVVEGVNKSGEYDLKVEVKAKNGTKLDVKDISPKTVKVKFDTIAEKDFNVSVEAPDITAAENFLLEPITSNPASIKIRGPKQELDNITKVVARTNLKQNLKESLSIEDSDFILYNGDTVIDKSPFTFSEDKVEIRVPVFMQKKLPLKIDILNAPPNFDLSLLNYSLSESEIHVAAPVSSLSNLGEIHLGYLNLKNIDINSTYEYNVSLPEKYKNLSGFTKVSVNFKWDEYAYKYIAIDKSKLFVINAPSKYDVKLNTNAIYNIKLIGPKNIIKNISADDIIGEINLLDVELNESAYRRPVQIYSPKYANVWAYGDYSVSLDITQKANATSVN